MHATHASLSSTSRVMVMPWRAVHAAQTCRMRGAAFSFLVLANGRGAPLAGHSHPSWPEAAL